MIYLQISCDHYAASPLLILEFSGSEILRDRTLKLLKTILLFALAGCTGSSQSAGAEFKFDDPETGCAFFLQINREPKGVAMWSGFCADGLAEGIGTIKWANSDSLAPLRSEAEVTGNMVDGVLQGKTTWKMTDYYSNVVHTSRFEGGIVDGVRYGQGVEILESEFVAGQGFESIIVRYEGGWSNNEFSGVGRREELKLKTDGAFEKLTESGQFSDNMLNGKGIAQRAIERADGTVIAELSDGVFENRQFIGFGALEYSSERDGEIYHSITEFEGHIRLGGTGTIEFTDGDRFSGSVDARGQPQHGNCNLVSKNYDGNCSSAEFPTSDFSADICLVSEADPDSCMKIIGSWIS